jgi:hypothetical protein
MELVSASLSESALDRIGRSRSILQITIRIPVWGSFANRVIEPTYPDPYRPIVMIVSGNHAETSTVVKFDACGGMAGWGIRVGMLVNLMFFRDSLMPRSAKHFFRPVGLRTRDQTRPAARCWKQACTKREDYNSSLNHGAS